MKVYVLVHKTKEQSEIEKWNEGVFSSYEKALSKVPYIFPSGDKYYVEGNDYTLFAEWYEIEEYFLEVAE